MFLICSVFTPRSNPSGRFLGGSCVHVCVATSKQQKTVLSGGKKGPHSYRLSQKNTGEDNICSPFLCLFILLSNFVSHTRACHCPSSKISGWHWPDFTVFILFFTHHQPQCRVPLALPHNTGSDQLRKRWGGRSSPTADHSELELLFVLLLLLQFFFESTAVGRVSGFSWPLVGQVKVKRGAGLCRLLVGFVYWFAAIHDHGFAGCAFGRRAPGEFRHRLPYVVQRWLSVHRN